MKTKYAKRYNGEKIEYRMFFSKAFSTWCVKKHTYTNGWGYAKKGTKAECEKYFNEV